MTRKLIVAVTVLALVATGGFLLLRPKPPQVVSADFAYTDGIYVGNRVHVLGVPVGEVRSVDPRGDSVRVTMELEPGTPVPASAHAYIMNPAVISDRFVELTPGYTGGPKLGDRAVIPVERTHAPLRWDALMSSMDSLVAELGPNGAAGTGDLGAALHDAAVALDGKGPRMREAIRNIAGASDVVAGNKEQLGALLDNLDQLVNVLSAHKDTMRSLSATVARAGETYSQDQVNLGGTIQRLSHVLTQVDELVTQHGSDLTGTLANAARVSQNIGAHQHDIAQTLDTLPLALGNFSRAITEDERMRIRLSVSTNLSQFAPTRALCERLPVPLCAGAGIFNPLPLPPRILDPLLPGGGG